jgi:hypothetical protein
MKHIKQCLEKGRGSKEWVWEYNGGWTYSECRVHMYGTITMIIPLVLLIYANSKIKQSFKKNIIVPRRNSNPWWGMPSDCFVVVWSGIWNNILLSLESNKI